MLVDVIVGVFTVWGLYWAATELALRPDLSLVITQWSTRRDKADVWWIGRDDHGRSSSLVRVCLFLENTKPKAAQYVRIVLRIRGVPSPELFRGLTSY